MTTTLYLASQSPRRRELFTQMGISFEVLSVDINESIKNNETAEEYVARLATEKALAGWKQLKTNIKPVLGSDTSVVINGEILGKPENLVDAKRKLNLLSGNTHQVMMAVALVYPMDIPDKSELSLLMSVSDVRFKILSVSEIERYIASGEGDDKAGSYAIQDAAAAFITHLPGSYSGVMGLPLYETMELPHKAGISQDSLVVP